MKTTILPWMVCICLLAITTAQAQRGTRIGYVDMEYILESVPDYQEAKTMLDGRVQGWKRDIERMNQEIDQMKLNLSNERILLTPELIEEREVTKIIIGLPKNMNNTLGPSKIFCFISN